MTTAPGAAELGFDAGVSETLRMLLPRIAEETVAAIIVEVPSYAGPLSGRMGQNIENAVQMAIGGFLTLTSRNADASTPLAPAIETAYALGQGEARSDRSMDALLTAYRVGARVAWREMAIAATNAGMSSSTMARFAELLFAYIDELSAASVAGHTDQLSTSGRVRDRYLEDLCRLLLSPAGGDELIAGAEKANWATPKTLTAVLLPASHVRGVMSRLGSGTLQFSDELPGLDKDSGLAVLFVPDMDGSSRQQLLRQLADRLAIVGPAKPWTQVRSSYLRTVSAKQLNLSPEDFGPSDTELHLAKLVIGADPEALSDLRDRALAPLSGLRTSTADKLAETLRSWLLHQGRRDDVAADLFVHAQTVRYRMGQLRELYGERLNDPATVLELTIALADLPPGR
ncbi:MAG: helix-turn-helix domain-containing protein [Aeromicrobium sp.]